MTDDCVEHLTKEMSAGVDGSMVVSRLTNGSNEFSIEFVNSSSSNSGSMTSRQERLDSLLDGLVFMMLLLVFIVRCSYVWAWMEFYDLE